MEVGHADRAVHPPLRARCLGGRRRLAAVVGRYREALEIDFATRYPRPEDDLTALWQARRWRRLLNLIEGLPQNSHYSAAVAADEEYAEALAQAGVELPKAGAPSLTSWSPEVGMLARVVDGLQSVVSAVVASTGTRPKTAEPVKRPESALDKALADAAVYRRKRTHEALVALVTRPGAPSMADPADGSETTFTTPQPE